MISLNTLSEIISFTVPAISLRIDCSTRSASSSATNRASGNASLICNQWSTKTDLMKMTIRRNLFASSALFLSLTWGLCLWSVDSVRAQDKTGGAAGAADSLDLRGDLPNPRQMNAAELHQLPRAETRTTDPGDPGKEIVYAGTPLIEVLKAGAAYSRVMDDKGQKMLDHDFSVEAKLSQHLKDVRLIRAAATAKNAKAPLSQVHRQLLERLEAAGYGEIDNSAIIMAYE